MRPATRLYLTLQRMLRRGTPLLGRGHSKLARAMAGRLLSGESLRAWARDTREAGRPGAWFHAPSVGEGLQARAVLEALMRRRPAVQTVFTHLSPSAESLARGMPSGWSGYLPWDLPEEMGPTLDAVRPGLVAFAKTEAWPVLVEEAARRGVPVALVGGVMPPGARRDGRLARFLLRPTWRRMSVVGAVSEADAQGFARVGVDPAVIHVTGDPGIDSAASRAAQADFQTPWLAPFVAEPRPTLVAGSTWPSDLRVLLPALEEVRRRVPGLRVVVAPHEPSAEVVRGVLADFFGRGWLGATLSEVEAGGAGGVDVVVVDRLGVLAHLYTVGDVAYVGGGFHAAGLHSVLEPAAARLPVLFGPGHASAQAAAQLLECGGGMEVAGAAALAEALTYWLTDGAAHHFAATRAADYIVRHSGAADRTAGLLDDLLSRPGSRS